MSTELTGRYRIVGRIAEGGMAVVDRAVAVGPDGFEREVVIKRIRPRFGRDERFARMFLDEARIASQLIHPNIVHIHELGKVGDEYFLAMEYVPGVDLARLQRRLEESKETFPVPIAVFVGIEVCRALDYAHRKTGPDGTLLGIVHRDVTPQNILLSNEGGVKLADFGIARAAARKEQTLDGVVKGKVRYMSPEQLRGEPLDSRSDLFSAGVVLYELLAGRHPFAGKSDASTIENLLTLSFPPPSSVATDIHPDIDRVVMRACEHQRRARFETAAEMAAELESFLYDHHLKGTASDLATLMQRLYAGREGTGAHAPVRIDLDRVVASELERIAGPGGEVATFTESLAPADGLLGGQGGGTLQMFPTLEHVGARPRHSGALTPPAPLAEERVPEASPQPAPAEPSSAGSTPVARARRGRFAAVALALVAAGAIGVAVLSMTRQAELDGSRAVDAAAAAFVATAPPVPRPVAADASAAEASAGVDAAFQDGGGEPRPEAEPPDAPSAHPAHEPGRSARGWLRVTTRPHYAEVYVDGARVGTTPLLVEVRLGRRSLRLVNAQVGRSERRSVLVEAADTNDSPASVVVEDF